MTRLSHAKRDRIRRSPQAHLALDPVSISPLHRRLSRSHQRRLRGTTNAPTTRLYRRRLWPWRRNVLRRLFLFSDAQQLGSPASRRTPLDLSAHGRLGPDLSLDDPGQRPPQFLPPPFFARSSRSRILSRSHPLPEELVPSPGASPHRGPIHDRRPALRSPRWSHLRCASRPASNRRPRGMAMDVSNGRDSSHTPRRSGIRLSGRSARTSALALHRRARLAGQHAATRTCRNRHREWPVRRPPQSPNMDAGARLFWTHHRFLRREPVAAHPYPKRFRGRQFRHRIALRHPLPSRGSRHGRSRHSLRSHRRTTLAHRSPRFYRSPGPHLRSLFHFHRPRYSRGQYRRSRRELHARTVLVDAHRSAVRHRRRRRNRIYQLSRKPRRFRRSLRDRTGKNLHRTIQRRPAPGKCRLSDERSDSVDGKKRQRRPSETIAAILFSHVCARSSALSLICRSTRIWIW